MEVSLMLKVKKRDGRLVMFSKGKIEHAILKAFEAVDGEISDYAKSKAENIADYIDNEARITDKIFTVEDIQDMIEHGLMSTKRKDVARAYITYRNERTRARQQNSAFYKMYNEKIAAENVQNQNANVDERSFGGRAGEARNAANKQFALDYYVSAKARYNHINNRIYIHDLDHYILGDHNCLSVPFDKILANGVSVRQGDIRPPASVSTALQLVAVYFQIQSLQQFGGVSATHLDWTMVPYIRKSFIKHMQDGLRYIEDMDERDIKKFRQWFTKRDLTIDLDEDFKAEHQKAYKYAIDMTEREVNQGAEALYHNLNSLQSRSGNQLPFTSINFGTCTLPEGRMMIKALLNASLDGIGHLHRTPIFPCSIFQAMKGVNRVPGDPNYDLYKLALKSTAKRLYPNYANVDWSGNEGYDKNDPRTYFSTMGKRKLSSCKIF